MSEVLDEINKGANAIKEEFNVLKIHRNYIYIIAVVITIFICILLFQEYQHTKNTNDLIGRIENYSDSAKHYKNKYGLASYNETLKLNTESQLKSLFAKNDTISKLLKSFKKIGSLVITKEKIYLHDTIFYPKDNIIPCSFTPFNIIKDSLLSKTKPFYFKGTIFQNKFLIDSLLITNKQEIVVGTKRIGLFRKEERAEIKNSNQLISVSNVGAYTVVNKKKWYERPVLIFFGGAIIGVTAASLKK